MRKAKNAGPIMGRQVCPHQLQNWGKSTKIKSIKLAIFKVVGIAVVVITEIWYVVNFSSHGQTDTQ